jgi:hypothetical protein
VDVIDCNLTADAVHREMLSLCPCTSCRGRISEEGFADMRDIIRAGLWSRPIASIAFPLFTGLNVLSSHFPEDESARSGGGISIFLPSLVNPATNSLSQLRINIVAGYIEKTTQCTKTFSMLDADEDLVAALS